MTARGLSLAGAILLAAIAGAPAPASSHSFPETENPAAGQTLASSPSEVSIRFDAPIEKLFAVLRVLDAAGRNVAAGQPAVGPGGYTLSVKVPPLKPGEYTVKWGVVCIDTHHTQGSYTFTVATHGNS